MTLPKDLLSHRQFDELIALIINNQLEPHLRKDFLTHLATDLKFREEFCDWIRSSRSLRDWPDQDT